MNTHWKKPRRFDRNLVVIGAGSAGLVSALVAAKGLSRNNRIGG